MEGIVVVKRAERQIICVLTYVMLLLTSSIVFTVRNVTYKTTGKELSEIKSFGIVQQYFNELYNNIFKGKMVLFGIFRSIIKSIQRYGIKSKRKDKKAVICILQNVKISESQLLKLAV